MWLVFLHEYVHCTVIFFFPQHWSKDRRPESDSMVLPWDLSIVTFDYSCILKMLIYLSFPKDCESPECRHSSLFHHKQLIGWQAKKRLSCWLDIYSTPFWHWTYLVALTVKRLPAMWETRVRSLGQEDPLEKENVTYSSIPVCRIPWTEESGKLQSMGSQRVGHDWVTSLSLLFFFVCVCVFFLIFFLIFNFF